MGDFEFSDIFRVLIILAIVGAGIIQTIVQIVRGGNAAAKKPGRAAPSQPGADFFKDLETQLKGGHRVEGEPQEADRRVSGQESAAAPLPRGSAVSEPDGEGLVWEEVPEEERRGGISSNPGSPRQRSPSAQRSTRRRPVQDSKRRSPRSASMPRSVSGRESASTHGSSSTPSVEESRDRSSDQIVRRDLLTSPQAPRLNPDAQRIAEQASHFDDAISSQLGAVSERIVAAGENTRRRLRVAAGTRRATHGTGHPVSEILPGMDLRHAMLAHIIFGPPKSLEGRDK